MPIEIGTVVLLPPGGHLAGCSHHADPAARIAEGRGSAVGQSPKDRHDTVAHEQADIAPSLARICGTIREARVEGRVHDFPRMRVQIGGEVPDVGGTARWLINRCSPC